MEKPLARREPVEEWVHGIQVVDPYRWLEKGDDPRVKAWERGQTAYAEATIQGYPAYAFFRKRLEAILFSQEMLVGAVARGAKVFFARRLPQRGQVSLWMREGEEEKLLVDPEADAPDGSLSLDWWYPSPRGTYVAFGLSRDGTEDSTLYVLEVGKGLLSDAIPHTRFASVAWLPDETGFYYTRHPARGEVPEGEEFFHRRVFFHTLGRPFSEDPLIFGKDRPIKEMPQLSLSPDGRFLLILAHHGWQRTEIFLLDREKENPEPLWVDADARFHGFAGSDFIYLETHLDAPYGRILRLPVGKGPEAAEELLRGSREQVVEGMAPLGEGLLVSALHHGVSRLYALFPDGSTKELSLPGMGTVSGLWGSPGGERAFFLWESFLHAPQIWEARWNQGEVDLRVWKEPRGVDLSRLKAEVKVKEAISRDGTRIPVFVLEPRREKGQGERDEPREGRPTVLTGYGGFALSRTPTFQPAIIPWLEAGGAWAQAILRGGFEYGEPWHRDGMREKKQNVFDDFLAAAEMLLAERVAAPGKLGIFGRSNGGLLVGAAMTQRPELFGAVVCGVPLLDMIRFHLFLLGPHWTGEYGDPENPEDFHWLYAYSPYHRVQPGKTYPPVFFFAAAQDGRVDPLHARKMAALLQEQEGEKNPVLLRVEEGAGHGAGKPAGRVVEEQALVWAFFAHHLDLQVSRPDQR
ncbi:MAG: prolyl oligopeptidase family serine peptidase [Clostridiales bacterium]|nr:prolyl oligopeptidase family serine peptidase [Clostridiales bacterium]